MKGNGKKVKKAATEDLEALGRDAIKAPWEIPGQQPETLRKFVLDYVGGQIFTNYDVPPDMFGLVFMPWSFANDPPELVSQLGGDPGPEPEVKSKAPELPASLKKPAAPRPQAKVKADAALVKQLEIDIGFQAKAPEDLANYLAGIDQQNQAIQQANDQAQADWEAQCREIEQRGAAEDKAYREALQAHEAEVAAVAKQHPLWEQAQERYSAMRKGAVPVFYQNIGCIYGHVKDSMPRSVNGLPMFHTVGCLNKTDWERARAAIIKKMKENEELEV